MYRWPYHRNPRSPVRRYSRRGSSGGSRRQCRLETLARRVGLTPIAASHGGTRDPDLADLPCGAHHARLGIDDPHVHGGGGDPAAHDVDGFGIVLIRQ